MKLNLRFINRANFSKLGTFSGVLIVICLLASLILNVAESSGNINSSNLGGNLIALLQSAISIIFYLLITNYFRKSKENLGYGFYAILIILISDYIIPIIFSFINGLIGLTIIFPSLMAILSIIYFIFLSLENRKREKKYCLYLKIIGIVFASFSLGYGIYNIVMMIEVMTTINLDGLLLASSIISLVQTFASMICLPLIFGLYPFVLSKERLY